MKSILLPLGRYGFQSYIFESWNNGDFAICSCFPPFVAKWILHRRTESWYLYKIWKLPSYYYMLFFEKLFVQTLNVCISIRQKWSWNNFVQLFGELHISLKLLNEFERHVCAYFWTTKQMVCIWDIIKKKILISSIFALQCNSYSNFKKH